MNARLTAVIILTLSVPAANAAAQRPASAQRQAPIVSAPAPQRATSGATSAAQRPAGASTANSLRRAENLEELRSPAASRQDRTSDLDAETWELRERLIDRDYQRAASGAWRRRGEIVVAAEDDGIDAAARDLGLDLKQRARLPAAGLTLTTWMAPDGARLESLVAQLRAARPRDAVDLNYIYEYREAASGRGRSDSAPPPRGDGRAKVAAIIEAGLPVEGPWLQGVNLKGARFSPGPSRSSDHATAVAALLMRSASAQGSTLLAADVGEAGPLEGAAAGSIALAADWAAQEGAKVINVSMTGPRNAILDAVIDRLAARGVTIVAAAGNGGPRADPPWPAAHRAVVAVTAVDSRHRIWRRATQGPHVDFAAEGVDVPAGGKVWTGTSMAAPVVAGTLLREGGNLRLLTESALDLGAPGRDPVFGEGLIAAP